MNVATRKSEFFAGLRAMAPVLPGVIPFAMISGVAALKTGLSPLSAMCMSVFMFAGAAQLATLQLLADHTSVFIITLTVIMINLRMALYSAGLAPYFSPLSTSKKVGLSYFLTDQIYALSLSYYTNYPEREFKEWFYWGGAIVMALTWHAGTLAGVLLGSALPDHWELAFSIPLSFLALMVPMIKNKALLASSITAAIVAIIGKHWPFNAGLLLATLSGIIVGLLISRFKK